MLCTVSEVSKRTGMSAHTLRYYDREGLLPFVERSASGMRVFKEKDFAWLQLIECLKASGVPLKEIRQYIDWYQEGNATLAQRRNMFHNRKQVVEEQVKALNKTLDMLTYKCWFYDVALEAGDGDAPKQMDVALIPEAIRAAKQRAFRDNSMASLDEDEK